MHAAAVVARISFCLAVAAERCLLPRFVDASPITILRITMVAIATCNHPAIDAWADKRIFIFAYGQDGHVNLIIVIFIRVTLLSFSVTFGHRVTEVAAITTSTEVAALTTSQL